MNDFTESRELELILPFPPAESSNFAPVVRFPSGDSKRERPFASVRLTKKGRQYKKLVEEAVQSQLGMSYGCINYPLQVSYYWFPPSTTLRDMANYRKAVDDSLTDCGVWLDDSLIKVDHGEWCEVIHAQKTSTGEKIPAGKVIIRILALPDWIAPTWDEIHNWNVQPEINFDPLPPDPEGLF